MLLTTALNIKEKWLLEDGTKVSYLPVGSSR